MKLCNDESGSAQIVEPPLGNNANNVAALVNTKHGYKPLRKQLYKSKKALTKAALGSDRVCRCRLHTLGKFTQQVKVDAERPFIHLENLETCGSVWACPVCRHRILNVRSEQLKNLYDNFIAAGGRVSLLTLTVPHQRFHTLASILGSSEQKTGLSGAFRRLRQSRLWRSLKSSIGYEADTRVYEMTYGQNGFHLHVHVALYHWADPPDNIQDKFLSLWSSATQSAGFTLINSHGVDFRDMSRADYLAKWGAPSELSASSQKQASGGSLSVHQLETLFSQDEGAYFHSRPVAGILDEYYTTMHGKKLLTWAGDRTFRQKYGPELEKTDEELAEISLEKYLNTDLQSEIDSSTWKRIYFGGDVPILLEHYEKYGTESAVNFILNRYDVDVSREFEHTNEDLFSLKTGAFYYRIVKRKPS